MWRHNGSTIKGTSLLFYPMFLFSHSYAWSLVTVFYLDSCSLPFVHNCHQLADWCIDPGPSSECLLTQITAVIEHTSITSSRGATHSSGEIWWCDGATNLRVAALFQTKSPMSTFGVSGDRISSHIMLRSALLSKLSKLFLNQFSKVYYYVANFLNVWKLDE